MSNADNLPAEADFPAENLPDEGNSNLADELSEEEEFPAEYNSEDERERQNEIQRKKDQEE